MKSRTALRLIFACLAALSLALVGAKVSVRSGGGTHLLNLSQLTDPDAISATTREGTLYSGTADGGLWKTTDAGKTWAPLLDGQPSDAVGAVTLDPKNPNIIYVGTGEADLSGDSDHGAGILRSTDGGQTWTDLGYSAFVNRAIGT